MFSHVSREMDRRFSLSSVLAPVMVPVALRHKLRDAQINAINKLGLLVVLTNLLSATLIMLVFSGNDATGLGMWSSAMCFACALHFFQSMNAAQRPEGTVHGLKAAKDYTIGAALFGVLWAVIPVVYLPKIDDFAQIATAAILSSMIFGGGFILSRLPQAAFSFFLPISAGLVVGVFQIDDVRIAYLGLMIVVYAAVMAVAVRWNFTLFAQQFLSEAEINQQRSLIGLLLRDFEATSSDWLWQTDEAGVLVDLPLAIEAGKSGYSIMEVGRDLISLFEGNDARNVLALSLVRKQSFRDLVLMVRMNDETRWWSLSGKPVYSEGRYVGFRGVASDVTQSKQIEDRIAFMAHYDGLTGLPNRITFHEELEKTCLDGPTAKGVRAVLWMDLDNFKWVNDTLGHPAGDELLVQFATRLSDACQVSDVIARLGGDEFAVIVERFDRTELRVFLDNLVDRLARPYEVLGSTANCSASVGVRVVDDRDTDVQVVLSHADMALYRAKKTRKGTWCEFSPDMEERARARRVIEADLHNAVETGQLHLKFQPIVDAQTREIASLETLMRWDHPLRGAITPSDFIEHAEDCGLINRIGEWAIREALSQARRLPPHIGVSVNISPLQLHSSKLITTIMSALAHTGIDPARLDMEITESVLMSDTEFVLERLNQLKQIGLKISLDDFGTGFSSLSYLRTYPFDKLKIDKCFVSDLETNEDSRAITRATLTLANSLGMPCTAEGVETEAQAQFLIEHGCDKLQGFLISRARQMDELPGLELTDLDMGDASDTRQSLRLVPTQPDRPIRRAGNG
ncbi:MAG: EAL domain-containing protein [Pseudomonadota bacterium]